MAETVTSLFGGHRQPADRPPASWPIVRPAACLQSFGYATLTSSAPSSSTEPARRDTDDSLTSCLTRSRPALAVSQLPTDRPRRHPCPGPHLRRRRQGRRSPRRTPGDAAHPAPCLCTPLFERKVDTRVVQVL